MRVAAVAMVYRNVAMSEEAEDSRPNANAEVARLFSEIGDILEIKGEPPFRYNAYRTAARSVANATERVDALFGQGRLRELNGVGTALEAKIVEYLSTGRMAAHDRELRDFPVALTTLLRVPGLGPGRARSLYKELGISTVNELEEVARSGRLKEVPGFGPKAVESLLVSLERLKQASTRGLLSDASAAFEQVRGALGLPPADRRQRPPHAGHRRRARPAHRRR
jgi:DNA polymerase (family X)